MSSLYELKGQYFELLEMMQDADDEEMQVIKDTIEAIDGDIEVKAENYAVILKELEADVEKYEKEIERLQARKESLKNRSKYLREHLFRTMVETGKTKFNSGMFKFSIVKNGGKQPLDIYGKVPEEFQKVEVKADNEKIRKALEEGKELDFAILQERGQHLSIK